MKKFTCKEMGGPCDTIIEGSTMEEVMKLGGEHVMTMNDEEHQKIAEAMNNGDEESKAKWSADFKALWDTKEEEVVA